jgi:hypothetical protein
MSAWPPPPDLDSIKGLVRDADTEEFIANGSPADEYDGEAEALFAAIGHFPAAELVAPKIVSHIEGIWMKSFDYDDGVLITSRPGLLALASQIARFFGPEAQPKVRNQTTP